MRLHVGVFVFHTRAVLADSPDTNIALVRGVALGAVRRCALLTGACSNPKPGRTLARPVSPRKQRVLVGKALPSGNELVLALEAGRRVAPLACGRARGAVVVLKEGLLVAHEADVVLLAGARTLLRNDADAVLRQPPCGTHKARPGLEGCG